MKILNQRASRVCALERIASATRRETVQVLADIGHEHRGHPGAALSIADIVTALYHEVMRIDPSRPEWPDRDRLVLSKGHGCMSLYVTLSALGYFARQHLRTFRSVDSILQGHPDMRKTPWGAVGGCTMFFNCSADSREFAFNVVVEPVRSLAAIQIDEFN
jgi:transketolase N-terminal domain/subunit